MWRNFKFVVFLESRKKQRVVIKFLILDGKVQKCLWRTCLRLQQCVQVEHKHTRRRQCCRKSVLLELFVMVNSANREKAVQLVRQNGRISADNLTTEFDVSHGKAHCLIDLLGYWKVSARCIFKQLIHDWKTERVDCYTSLLQLINSDKSSKAQSLQTITGHMDVSLWIGI